MFKLLKHDIRDSYFEVLVLNGLLLASALIMAIGVSAEISFLLTIGAIAWAAVLFAVFFVIVRVVIKSFHTMLFTDCGYLTLTTPVSIDKILLSKIIVSMLWIITTVIAVISCLLIVISILTSAIDMSIGSMLESLAIYIKSDPLTTFKVIVMGLASVLSFILTLLFVLVLSNTGRMKKHKKLKGILIYIAIVIVISQIGQLVENYIGALILELVWSVVLYLAARFLIVRKLELE